MYGETVSSASSIVWWIVGGVAFIALLTIIYRSFFTVPKQEAAVVMRFGKVSKIAFEGINAKAFFDNVPTRVDLRQQQLNLKVETKTKDNIFVDVTIAVQFNVDRMKVEDAVFKLEEPQKQMAAYITNSVRAQVPLMTLENFFEKKEEIAENVKKDLEDKFTEFGFQVHTALVTDITPDKNVKESLNNISVSLNNLAAATNNAQAAYTLKVKEAEADKESKRLQGEGIALQRKAIVAGLEQSVLDFTNKIPGTNPHEVMSLVIVTQQMDMLTHMGGNSKKNVVFLNADPTSVLKTKESILQGIAAGNEADPGNEPSDANSPTRENFNF